MIRGLFVLGNFDCVARSLQYLLEILGNHLIGSPKSDVNHTEPLIMAYNMKEHRYLLLDRGVDAIF